MTNSTPLVEMRGISKHFGGLQALTDVSIDLYPGEVVGLLGHNGAGKSTLIKILAGAQKADEGQIVISGEQAHIENPTDARSYGIETIYQELALCGNLNASANLFMGREVQKYGFLQKKFMREEAAKALSRLSIKIKSLDAEVESMSGGQRQAISISRAVHFNAKILIMDEPTAALGMEETEMVIKLIQELKKTGIGIFWISHDIHDVYAFTDRIAILNGGKNVITCPTQDYTKDEIVSMIISGRPMPRSGSGAEQEAAL